MASQRKTRKEPYNKPETTVIARLKKTILNKIAKKEIHLSGRTIDVLVATLPYIDKDGRVYVDFEKIRKELIIHPTTMTNALEELQHTYAENSLPLLTKEEDGFYYAHYIDVTNGTEEAYQQNYKVYLSPEVLELPLNTKLLFYLLASWGRHVFESKLIYIENLYNNQFHDAEHGITYFDSYKALADALFKLIEKGLIEVCFRKDNEVVHSDHPMFYTLFHQYCEYSTQQNRKQRTSKNRKHLIELNIKKSLCTKEQLIANRASETEFMYYAIQNYFDPYFISKETIGYFIKIKNRLIEIFGIDEGLAIYRKNLIAYFSEHQGNVKYHEVHHRATNYFKDHYVLPELNNMISTRLANNEDTEALHKLIQYYLSDKVCSDNHLIKLDMTFTNIGGDWKAVVNSISNPYHPYILLHKRIQMIYIQQQHSLNEGLITPIPNELVRDKVHEWAKNNLLMDKENLKLIVEETKKKLLWYRPIKDGSQNPKNSSSSSTSSYYNRRELLLGNDTSKLSITTEEDLQQPYDRSQSESRKNKLLSKLYE